MENTRGENRRGENRRGKNRRGKNTLGENRRTEWIITRLKGAPLTRPARSR